MHEVGHTLGFFHEQSRPDRNDFVDIIYKNIASFRELNFEKYDETEINTYDIPYDLSSIMHYGSLYFSAGDNNITVASKDPRFQRTIGQRSEISFSDYKTTNKIYCGEKCANDLPCQRGGYPNPKKCDEWYHHNFLK
jgi:hypothetical protein